MQVSNKTKNTPLSNNTVLCNTLLSKARGLMFSKQKDLLFVEKKERFISLHMVCVFYSIDVLYLNTEKKVVEIKENLLPFTFYFPKQKAQYILELKKGTIGATQTTLGDLLAFQ